MTDEQIKNHLKDVLMFTRIGENSNEITTDFSDDEVDMIRQLLGVPKMAKSSPDELKVQMDKSTECLQCGKKFTRKSGLELLCPDCMAKVTGYNPDEFKPADNGFVKADNGKLEWDLMPFEQLEDVVKILMFGAKKYSKGNWQKCENPDRYVNALMRHTIAYAKGNKIDDESGLSHLAHAICNCLFLMWFDDHSEDKALEEAYRRIHENENCKKCSD